MFPSSPKKKKKKKQSKKFKDVKALSQPELLQGDASLCRETSRRVSLPPSLPPHLPSSVCCVCSCSGPSGGWCALHLLSSIYYRRPLCSSPSNKKRALDARMWHLRSHPPDCNVELFPTGHMRRLINVEPSGGFPSEALTGQPCVPR